MVLGSNMNPAAWVGRKHGAFTDAASFLPTFLRQRSDVGARKTLNAFLDLCGRTSTARCAFSAGTARARARSSTRCWAGCSPARPGRILRRLGEHRGCRALRRGGLGRARQDAAEAVDTPSTSPAAVSCRSGAVAPGHARRGARGRSTPVSGSSWGSSVGRARTRDPRVPRHRRVRLRPLGPVSGGWTWLAEPCATWPTTAAVRYAGPWNHRTANPVLVIGITHDPPPPTRTPSRCRSSWHAHAC